MHLYQIKLLNVYKTFAINGLHILWVFFSNEKTCDKCLISVRIFAINQCLPKGFHKLSSNIKHVDRQHLFSDVFRQLNLTFAIVYVASKVVNYEVSYN